MSVCLSVHLHTSRLPLGWFSWNLILEYFSKIYWENSSFIKIGQEERVLYTFSIIFCSFFLGMKNVSPKSCRETHNTLFMFNNFFFENHAVYEMWPRELCSLLGHKVCRKPTHTNLYLHQNSHHHPANKQSFLASIIHRAKALCDHDSLTQELEFLTTVFKENGYSCQQIWWVLKTVTWAAKTNERLTSIAFIPYTQTANGQLSRMLAKHNNKSVSLPSTKLYSYLPLVRNALRLRTLGIYSIPSDCGQVYIGQSSWSIQIQIKEHSRHIMAGTNKKMSSSGTQR